MVMSNLWEVKMRGRKIIASILALTLIVGISAMTVAPASAATRLGGVSVYNACKYQYKAAWSWEVFILPNTYNVMGWRCYLNGNHYGYVELNLNTECRREYGSLAHAAYDDFNNPYSWYCYK